METLKQLLSPGALVLIGGLITLLGGVLTLVGSYWASVEQQRHERVMTGGDSYLSLVLKQDANGWHVVTKHHGNYPLHGVEVRTEAPEVRVKSIGEVTGNSTPRGVYSLQPSKPDEKPRRIRAQMSARTDAFIQEFTLTPTKAGGWEMVTHRLYRTSDGKELTP